MWRTRIIVPTRLAGYLGIFIGIVTVVVLIGQIILTTNRITSSISAPIQNARHSQDAAIIVGQLNRAIAVLDMNGWSSTYAEQDFLNTRLRAKFAMNLDHNSIEYRDNIAFIHQMLEPYSTVFDWGFQTWIRTGFPYLDAIFIFGGGSAFLGILLLVYSEALSEKSDVIIHSGGV